MATGVETLRHVPKHQVSWYHRSISCHSLGRAQTNEQRKAVKDEPSLPGLTGLPLRAEVPHVQSSTLKTFKSLPTESFGDCSGMDGRWTGRRLS